MQTTTFGPSTPCSLYPSPHTLFASLLWAILSPRSCALARVQVLLESSRSSAVQGKWDGLTKRQRKEKLTISKNWNLLLALSNRDDMNRDLLTISCCLRFLDFSMCLSSWTCRYVAGINIMQISMMFAWTSIIPLAPPARPMETCNTANDRRTHSLIGPLVRQPGHQPEAERSQAMHVWSRCRETTRCRRKSLQ